MPIANRSALPSDYYSRKKITVTPLNFVCRRRHRRWRAVACHAAAAPPREKIFASRDLAKKFSHCAKMPIKYGFPRFPIFCSCGRQARERAVRARRRRRDGTRDAAFAPRKKLCTGRLCGRVDGSGEAQNARISANRFAARRPRRAGSAARRSAVATDFRFRSRAWWRVATHLARREPRASVALRYRSWS